MRFQLSVLEKTFSICRLEADSAIPAWAESGSFFSVTRTSDELSIVCEESLVRSGIEGIKVEPGWRAIKLHGPIPFTTIGVIASLSRVLAEAGVSIFCLSTYDTDFLLVKNEDLEKALDRLQNAGAEITPPN